MSFSTITQLTMTRDDDVKRLETEEDVVIASTKNKLKESPTLNWFRKRYRNTTKDQYIYTDGERKRCEEIIDMFQKFDKDKSGTLETDEIGEMFRQNGMAFTNKEIQKIFSIVDEDMSSTLT